jgi:CHC2 zinc finger
MNALNFDAWVERARAVPIEQEIARRGIQLKRSGKDWVGSCPSCGEGDDRFSINPRKGVWHCRKCKPESITGDVIGFVMHVDSVDFMTACTTLTKEPPPKTKSSGATHVNDSPTNNACEVRPADSSTPTKPAQRYSLSVALSTKIPMAHSFSKTARTRKLSDKLGAILTTRLIGCITSKACASCRTACRN